MHAADDDLLRPAAAAALAGVKPRTLAGWADAGLIASVVTVGGHRRYAAADLHRFTKPATEPAHGADPDQPVRVHGNRGSFARKGRPLTEAEVTRLEAAPTVHEWAALAAAYQADGSSIRQIAAATRTLPSTVAARIARATPAT